MPRLAIRSDAGPEVFHELADETITVGRAPENAIVIDDISVSSRHAELILIGESCFLKDLDSTNGTFVNGNPTSGVQLRPGDRIRLGKVEARFESDVTGSTQALPHLEEIEARPAEASARPADFTNASPFPNRKKEDDPTRTIVLAAAAIAVLAFIASMIAVATMRAPTL